MADSLTKHSWEWEYHPDFPDKVMALSAGDEDILICTGTNTAAFGLIKPEHALLIAAAPDMLAALKAIVEAWDSPPEKWSLKWTHLEAAKDAIAKVRG